LETTPSMATQSLQKFWLVDGLWHFLQKRRPQLLQVVRVSDFFPQRSQVVWVEVMAALRKRGKVFFSVPQGPELGKIIGEKIRRKGCRTIGVTVERGTGTYGYVFDR